MSIVPDTLYHRGGIPVGMEVLQPLKTRYLYSSTTGVYYKELSKTVDLNNLHATLTLAEAATTAGQNEIVFVTPNETHELAASVTWNNNDTHLIGMTLNRYQPHVDFTMAAGSGFNPMITISGRGGYFANLTFRHGAQTTSTSGLGNATDLTCATISGRYNYFENVYFYTPLYAEQDVAATYKGVKITGHNNYFRGCKFGSDGLNRDQANWNLSIEGGVGNMFEDCWFQMCANGTAPFFLRTYSTARDMKYTSFKNCTFYVHYDQYSVTPSYAFDATYSGNTAGVVLDNCNFINVGQVSDANKDLWIWKSNYEGENDAETTKVGMIALREQGV